MLGKLKRKNYLKLSAGKIRKQAEPDDVGAEKRTYKDDKGEVHELWEYNYDYLEGKIVGINKREHDEYGDTLEVEIYDGETNVLQMKMGSSWANIFLSKLPNVDLSQPVRLQPYYFAEDKRSALVILQGKDKVESFFNKDNPISKYGGPEFPAELLNKKEWNSKDKNTFKVYKLQRDGWLDEFTFKEIAPKIKRAADETVVKDVPVDETGETDLPF